MDSKELELYHEESRQKLIDLQKSVSDLQTELKLTLQSVLKVNVENPIEKVEVTGAVEVNTQDEVSVKNLTEIIESNEALGMQIAKAIAETYIAPPSEITVKNIKDAQPKSLSVLNLDVVTKELKALAKDIRDNQPIVNVEKQEITWPTNPKSPVAVRLSDGKSWINQMVAAMGAAMPEVDPMVGYQPSDLDESSSPKYYGFAKTNGAWYIMREDNGAYRYVKGDKAANNYAASWADKENLDYDYIYEVF